MKRLVLNSSKGSSDDVYNRMEAWYKVLDTPLNSNTCRLTYSTGFKPTSSTLTFSGILLNSHTVDFIFDGEYDSKNSRHLDIFRVGGRAFQGLEFTQSVFRDSISVQVKTSFNHANVRDVILRMVGVFRGIDDGRYNDYAKVREDFTKKDRHVTNNPMKIVTV